MTYDGLWNFGSFDDLNYELTELIIFVIMGAIGGVVGAFYNFVNHRITIFRMRLVSFLVDVNSWLGIIFFTNIFKR